MEEEEEEESHWGQGFPQSGLEKKGFKMVLFAVHSASDKERPDGEISTVFDSWL